MITLSAKINRAKPFQSIELRRAKFLRCTYAIVIKEIVRATLPITTQAYAVLHASLKSRRAQAFAVPLNTTAIAAHRANSLKRGTAIGLSSGSNSARVITPPTQRDSATTWITREPIASACEPLEAEWL